MSAPPVPSAENPRFNIPTEPDVAAIAENYREVQAAMREAAGDRAVNLVAVCKTKSPECVRRLYDAGQRVFGENYVQEITDKAPLLPADVAWHFVGHLQSNKVRELLEGVPGLAVLESVDTVKLARRVNDGCGQVRPGRPLSVFVQVNTSGEESKSGTEPGAVTVEVAAFIARECPNLRLAGLMTIGMLDYTSRPENFTCLTRCRAEVAEAVGVAPESLDLSMGMSGDYVNAIRMGSTTVRVGTSLFGQRYYPAKTDGD